MRIKTLAILVTWIGLACMSSQAQTQELIQVLSPIQSFLETDYEVIYSMDKIPPPVMAAIRRVTGGNRHGFANPGEDFNATDARDNRSDKRLIFAGKAKDTFFITYEQGGFVSQRFFLLLITDNSGAMPVWEGTITGSFRNIADLKNLVREGKISQNNEQ